MKLHWCLVLLCLPLTAGCAGTSLRPCALRKAYTQANTWVQAPTADVARIRRLVMDRLRSAGQREIAGIRWASTTEAVVYGKWRSAPKDKGIVYFLLRKENGRWRIVHRQDQHDNSL